MRTGSLSDAFYTFIAWTPFLAFIGAWILLLLVGVLHFDAITYGGGSFGIEGIHRDISPDEIIVPG